MGQVGSSITPEAGSIFWGNDISGDGRRIAITAWTGNLSDSATIEAFDFLDGDWTKVCGTLTTDTGVGDIALSRDGQTLAIGESEYLGGGAGSGSVYHWNESEEDWQNAAQVLKVPVAAQGFMGSRSVPMGSFWAYRCGVQVKKGFIILIRRGPSGTCGPSSRPLNLKGSPLQMTAIGLLLEIDATKAILKRLKSKFTTGTA